MYGLLIRIFTFDLSHSQGHDQGLAHLDSEYLGNDNKLGKNY